MHSFGYRANAVLTFAVMVLAIMCVMSTLSDHFHHSSPEAHVHVLEVHNFRKTRARGGDDEILMTLNITANFQSLFTWNTKQVFTFLAGEYETPKNSINQVSLWDAIIQTKEQAKFSIRTSKLKYRFVDQGNNLRGKEYNMTLHWHIMPKTGKMLVDKLVLTGFRMPEHYR